MNKENREALIKFREDRGWEKYHTKMNLIHAIGVEFGELSRLYQWGKNPDWQDVGEEIADVLIYLEYLAMDCGIKDTDSMVERKIKMNAQKYSVGQDWEKLHGWAAPCKK